VLADPVRQGGLDAVMTNATLHHLPDARDGLQRMTTLVRPGGALTIVTLARAG